MSKLLADLVGETERISAVRKQLLTFDARWRGFNDHTGLLRLQWRSLRDHTTSTWPLLDTLKGKIPVLADYRSMTREFIPRGGITRTAFLMVKQPATQFHGAGPVAGVACKE